VNIWWLNQHAGAPDEAGHTRNYSLAYYLNRQGHQVTLITSNFNHFSLEKRTDKISEQFINEKVNGIDFLWVSGKSPGKSYFSRLISMFSFARVCKKLTNLNQLPKPDIIIGSSPPLFTADAAMKLAKKMNVPFVLEVRDIWPQAIIDLKKTSVYHPLMIYMKFLERKLYKNASGIIAAMPYFSTYLHDQKIRVKKIKYLPHGIDYALFTGVMPCVQKDKFIIVHAGKFAVANHLVTVLEAAVLLKTKYPDCPIEFWLIGEGVDYKPLQQKAMKENLNNVKFFKPLSKNKIYGFMQQADALLLHVKNANIYRYGATTNRLSDYLASGRPLIYAFSSNTYDPVSSSECGISISSENPEALAQAAVLLYKLPLEQRVIMGERGMTYVKENHNLETLSKELSAFLIECLSVNDHIKY